MYRLFGFNIMSKEEEEACDTDFFAKIFPGGETEKKEVLGKLQNVLPRYDDATLLYLYTSLREHMMKQKKGFEAAWVSGKMDRMPVKLKKEELDALRRIVEHTEQDSL